MRREHDCVRENEVASTAELAVQLETQRILIDEVSGLPSPLRETVLLRYYHGMSCADIARSQGLDPATVRKRLERGLKQLRGRLDEKFPDRATWMGLLSSWPGPAREKRPPSWAGMPT